MSDHLLDCFHVSWIGIETRSEAMIFSTISPNVDCWFVGSVHLSKVSAKDRRKADINDRFIFTDLSVRQTGVPASPRLKLKAPNILPDRFVAPHLFRRELKSSEKPLVHTQRPAQASPSVCFPVAIIRVVHFARSISTTWSECMQLTYTVLPSGRTTITCGYFPTPTVRDTVIV